MPTARQLATLTPSERADYEERAAILEYDGGMPRRLAEQHAFEGLKTRLRHRWETAALPVGR